MWPVVDNGVWVGWLGQASFLLTGSNTTSYDNFLAHLNWKDKGSSGDFNTGTSQAVGIMCMDCNGEWQSSMDACVWMLCLCMDACDPKRGTGAWLASF